MDLTADTARHDIDNAAQSTPDPDAGDEVGQLAQFVEHEGVEGNHGDLETVPFDLLSFRSSARSDLKALCCAASSNASPNKIPDSRRLLSADATNAHQLVFVRRHDAFNGSELEQEAMR